MIGMAFSAAGPDGFNMVISHQQKQCDRISGDNPTGDPSGKLTGCELENHLFER